MRRMFWVRFTQCRLWNFHRQVLRLKWDLFVWSGNMADELFRGKRWAWITLWFLRLQYSKKGMHKTMSYFISQKDLSPINFTWKMSRMLVWSTRWEWLNSWAPPQILMSQCANHNKVATLHLEYVIYPIFLPIRMQRIPQKLKIFRILDWTIPCEHKGHFYVSIKVSRLHQNKHHWCSCKVCIGVAIIDWSQHPRMSSQHNKNMTTSTISYIFRWPPTCTTHVSMDRYPCWLHVYSHFDHKGASWVRLMGCLGS